jgi:hypothetical protein
MSGKYDQYIHNPPHLRLSMKADNSVFFDGLMAGQQLLGCDFTFGHQFVRKPFKGDNPCHTHDFQEFMAWYGSNPDDPDDFQAEIVFCFGEEMEKYIFTRPTIISIPPGLPHHPFEITRVDSPIIQIEIMIGHKDVPVTPVFEKDKGYNPMNMINLEVL